MSICQNPNLCCAYCGELSSLPCSGWEASNPVIASMIEGCKSLRLLEQLLLRNQGKDAANDNNTLDIPAFPRPPP